MDKNVPLALAGRAFDAYSATRQAEVDKKIAGAGFETSEPSVAKKEAGGLQNLQGMSQEERQKWALDKLHESDSSGPFGFLSDVGDAISGAVSWTSSKVAEGSTWLYNRLVNAPYAAGAATPIDFSSGGDGSYSMFDALKGVETYNKEHQPNVPVLSNVVNAVGEVEKYPLNWATGGYRLATGQMSDAQRKDIQSGGLNPDSLGDRVNFYSQDYGDARAPVNDADVQWLKGLGKYAPADVDAAREVVTSGALDNLSQNFSALSPRAQDFVLRVSNDPNANELLTAMADSSQNSLGGRIVRAALPDQAPGEWFGPGTTSRGILGAIAEVAATWHLDPAVLAAKGYQGWKAARWGVGGQAAHRLDETTQMLKASDEAFAPKGAVAKRFDEAMQTAEDIVQAGVSTPEAAKLRASWNRRYQGYDKTLDVLIGQRTGAIGAVRARTIEELSDEAKAAANKARGVQPYTIDVSPSGQPLWRFSDDEGKALSPEERATQRAKVADQLADFILLDAMGSGRELVSSRLLLPGQLSINGAIRDKITPVLEAFSRRDASVMKQLKETGKKPIDLNGHLLADEKGRWEQLVSLQGTEWLRNNYTFGLTHAFSRGWRNFERTFSNKVILPTSPDSVKVFGQLVSQFMPKRQAQMMTTMYAGANPAERWVMTRQTIGGLLNTMNLRNTPEAQKIVDQLTKGLVPEGEYIQGYKAGARESYTTPDNNFIRVGDLKMPAAVHPWQLSEGVELPNWRELRQLANRNAVMNTITRTSDGQTANALIRVWKSSKVTTWSNMFRQGGELAAFTAWVDPAVVKGYREARRAVKADVLTRKVNNHDLERLANHVNNLTPDDLADLEHIRRTKPEKYVETVSTMLQRDGGFKPGAAEVLARLGQDVDLLENAEFLASTSESRVRRLAMLGPLDRLRRFRAARAEAKGGKLTDSPLDEYLDSEMAANMLEAAAKQFGSAAESYAWNMAERSTHVDRQRITDAAGKNISFQPVKIVNGYEWADTNPTLWAAELGRRQADPIGNLTMQWIARRALADVDEAKRAKVPGEIAPDLDALTVQQMAKDLEENLPVDPARLGSADNLVAHLYAEHELGAGMRANGAAMQYLPDGKPVVSHADRIVAAEAAAKRAVDDLVHHMGGKVQRTEQGVSIRFPDEAEPLLRKLAAGKELSAAELNKLPNEVRPEGMVAPIYAPMIPEKAKGLTHTLSNLATRAYGAVVAEPLDKLFVMPAFIANRRLAQAELAPLMESLVERGMSHAQAAHMLEATVNNRAIARVFRGTDNPMEKTVFSEMGDKWLMFQRAQEDFLRRLIYATKAHPEGLARANILMQAGVHAGAMHYEPFQDEEGNTEYYLTFTYPGTALAQRVLSDAAAGLGFAPDEILRVPQFDGLKSQVRFLNPGFANPLQFSANPIFGMSTDLAEKIWPSATVELEHLKRSFSGGSDFEGTRGTFDWRNFVPSAFSRFTAFADQDNADEQFQSAMRSALMYAELAGQTPGADASPAERARYLDAVKATTFNIMLERAVFGMFAPASPQVADNADIETDTLARIQGLPSLRSEFFSIRNEMAQMYPDNFFRANSEAVAEFARRYPGELIANPSAFATGSTKIAGAEEGYAPYTIEATRWLIANKDFVQGNPTIALALMPASTEGGDFSNEAYKLQLKSDIRTHKDINEFYNDVTLSDDIGEYYKTRSAYFATAKANPAIAKSVYAKMDAWEDGWRRSHPLSSAELNRRSNPDFTHSEIAPGLQRLADGTDPLPSSLQDFRPQIKQMWDDYQSYRRAYMKVDYYNNAGRAKTNKAYQQAGDAKWVATPLENLWNLMRVTEGR